MAVALTVILGENTFYDIRDMRFIRFKQYDEILQGTNVINLRDCCLLNRQ